MPRQALLTVGGIVARQIKAVDIKAALESGFDGRGAIEVRMSSLHADLLRAEYVELSPFNRALRVAMLE